MRKKYYFKKVNVNFMYKITMFYIFVRLKLHFSYFFISKKMKKMKKLQKYLNNSKTYLESYIISNYFEVKSMSGVIFF